MDPVSMTFTYSFDGFCVNFLFVCGGVFLLAVGNQLANFLADLRSDD